MTMVAACAYTTSWQSNLFPSQLWHASRKKARPPQGTNMFPIIQEPNNKKGLTRSSLCWVSIGGRPLKTKRVVQRRVLRITTRCLVLHTPPYRYNSGVRFVPAPLRTHKLKREPTCPPVLNPTIAITPIEPISSDPQKRSLLLKKVW
jgi:hypothetical protein